MRNDISVFKIFLQTSYCWQKENSNRNDHSLSFAVTVDTCIHSLSLVVTSCHSLSLSLVCTFINHPRKISRDQKKTFACFLQKECADKVKNVQKIWNPGSVNVTFLKTVFHHGHIFKEYFDNLWESYFPKYLITCEGCLLNGPNLIIFVLIGLRKANPGNKTIY